MRVLALTPSTYDTHPGQRSSIETWERILTPAGIRLEYAPFESERLHRVIYQQGHLTTKAVEMLHAYFRRVLLLRDLDNYDAVLVYQYAAQLGPAFLEKLIARRKPIIYLIDDPIYVPYRSPFNGYLTYLKFFGKIADICRLSRVVIANSTHQEEYAAQYNKNVWHIPPIIDTERYVYRPESQADTNDPVCVGWSGSPSTVRNLSLMAEPLRELAGRVRHRVHLIGGKEFNLPGVNYTAQAWRAETEVEDLRRIQVGMVPLPVDEWTKRKFYMKVAQYMTLGIPPVCTPLGSNPYVIEHGVTGFLADTPAEWVDCLERLIKDSTLRRAMAARGAEVARSRYSLEANAARIIEAFKSALN